MRMQSAWLALAFVAFSGTAVRAQSPISYGMQPYPVYPQAQPGYRTPPAYAPNVYQPRPRVMYVPATPTTWQNGPAPAQPAVQQNQPEFVPPPPAPVAPRSATVGVLVTEADDDYVADGPHGRPRHLREDDTNWLPKGHWNMQLLGGFYSDIGDANYNWAQSSLRLGRVWNCERSPRCGGFEGIIDINGAWIGDSDFGNYFTGGGLLLRYNCVHLGSRIVPYAQVGVGFQYNDAYKELNQPYLGSRMQLTAQGQLGLRMFVTPYCSIDLEGGYQRIDEMGMSDRDRGIGAMGGMLGATYFFPCRR